jgi:ring-1,2-phenylacetyl-CoA epoxidase subunit PaaE
MLSDTDAPVVTDPASRVAPAADGVHAASDFHALTIARIERDADDALLLTLEVPAALASVFRFEPGQHLTLRRREGAQEWRRSYSICSAVGEPLQLGVRRVPGGAFSTWLHAHARAGQMMDVLPPQGRFGAALARPGRPRHIVAVAGGSGITPILAILKAVLTAEPGSRATLFYGNRSLATAMFQAVLDDLKNRHLARLAVHRVYSRETVDSTLHGGRLDRARLGDLLRLCAPVAAVDEAFVCGPDAFNDEAEAALLASGFAPSQVHLERFGVPAAHAEATPPAATPGEIGTARVTIVRDGVTREVAFADGDASVLAAAARAGLDLPFSCRSGVCATCRARVLEGSARMQRNFALEAAEVAAGYVLACQAQPLTERLVLSFDER